MTFLTTDMTYIIRFWVKGLLFECLLLSTSVTMVQSSLWLSNKCQILSLPLISSHLIIKAIQAHRCLRQSKAWSFFDKRYLKNILLNIVIRKWAKNSISKHHIIHSTLSFDDPTMNINYPSNVVRYRGNTILIYTLDLLHKYVNIKALLVFDIDLMKSIPDLLWCRQVCDMTWLSGINRTIQ